MTFLGNGPPETAGSPDPSKTGGPPNFPANRVVRLGHPSEGSEAVIAFLDRELRSSAGFSVREEYPSVFAGYPGGESLFYLRDGDVASHVAFTVREFLHPVFRMKIGLIGSVVTSKKNQGQGMASALLREAFSLLRSRGCALGVLWSDRPEFYRPMGFFRAGLETAFRFDPDVIPDAISEEGAAPRAFELSKHASACWRLYGKQALRLDRSLEEMKRLCRIPKLKLFVTESEGAVTSYLALNKGADFEDHVHEWAGDPAVVSRAVAILQKRHYPTRPLTLIGPASYAMEAFRRFGGHPSRGALGLVKLIDRRALRTVYLEYLRSLGISARWEDDLFVEGKRFAMGTDVEALRHVLGSDEGEPDVNPPRLPFFLWGLDSI